MPMMRRVAGVTLALLVAGFVFAGDVKEMTGTVKAVSGGTFTVTDSAAKDWTFAVDSKETLVVAKGGSHKMDKRMASRPSSASSSRRSRRSSSSTPRRTAS
jgi:hypothetical protein